MVGLAENKANSAQLELELGLSLAIVRTEGGLKNISDYLILFNLSSGVIYVGIHRNLKDSVIFKSCSQ